MVGWLCGSRIIKISKKIFVAYFKSLYLLIHAGAHQNHDKCSSGYPACRPRFEPTYYLILVRCCAKLNREEQKENLGCDFYLYDRESKSITQVKQQVYVLGVVVWHFVRHFFYINSIYGSKVSLNTTACSKASHTRRHREPASTIYNSVTRSLSHCIATKLCWWRQHSFVCERPNRVLSQNALTTNCDFEIRYTSVSFLVLAFDLLFYWSQEILAHVFEKNKNKRRSELRLWNGDVPYVWFPKANLAPTTVLTETRACSTPAVIEIFSVVQTVALRSTNYCVRPT